MKSFHFLLSGVLLLTGFTYAQGQNASTFENLTLSPEGYWDGSDGSGGFSSGNVYFYNSYNTEYDFWSGGFIYSNTTDTSTEGYTNDFSAFTGNGCNKSENYAVAYGSSSVRLTGALKGNSINGFFVTNTTYAALSMKKGDAFAKKFGGTSGSDADWFKLTITGYLDKIAKSDTVEVYLADFRFSDNTQDYIMDTWKWVDLTSLGNIDSLAFSLSSSDNTGGYMNTPAYFALDNFNDPLYAPAAGNPGTTAIYKDSSAFIAWATTCTVDRGPQNISNISLGDASMGEGTQVVGKAGNATVVSLGDGGSATLTFENPITNGPGNDFAVFENGFESGGAAYLELAFVEVSSDGISFFRFPAASLTDETVQTGSFALTDAKKINNLAGKYAANYGTPFDLEELKNEPGLDINHVTHVRIVDAVGSVNSLYATYDSYGNKVNDPWPTNGAASGFDLDAVGVIHTALSAGIATAYLDSHIGIYPNPSNKAQEITVSIDFPVNNGLSVQVLDYSGKLIKEQVMNNQKIKISSEGLVPGMYFLKVANEGMVFTKKLIMN